MAPLRIVRMKNIKKIALVSSFFFLAFGVLATAHGDGWTFVVAGHVRPDENFTVNPVLDGIVYFSEQNNIDALFLNGDSIYGALKEETEISREWDTVMAVLKRFSGEVYFVGGNHDLSTPELRRYYEERVSAPSFAFTKAGVRFIILDSTNLIGDVHSRKAQLQFLQSELLALPPETPFFLLVHHALWLKSSGNEGRAMWLMANRPNDAETTRLWYSEIAPLLRGLRGIVVSGDGGQHRVRYTYKKEDGILYLLNGVDGNMQEENVFFVFTADEGIINVQPISLMATPRICSGLNLLYRVDILGFPVWGRIWNVALRLLPLSMCTPAFLNNETTI